MSGLISEQEDVIRKLRTDNDKSNYVYRVALLVVYALLGFLYLTPIPTYLTGNHPKSHITLFLHPELIGTENDLTYLPAFPIYLAILLYLGFILYLASYELATRAGIIQMKGVAYPAQPHPFGTAPSWIVPVLRDIRLQPTSTARADPSKQDGKPQLSQILPPHIVYLGFLWVCTWPVPLITFGAGAFDDAAWWSFPFGVLLLHLIIEWWMYKAEREMLGLSGLKYNYKGA